MDTPSKNEAGILGTTGIDLHQNADAVKTAYNEVMYFKEMYNNYQQMKSWLKERKQGQQQYGTKHRTFLLIRKMFSLP